MSGPKYPTGDLEPQRRSVNQQFSQFSYTSAPGAASSQGYPTAFPGDYFTPGPANKHNDVEDYENEPPLLEELGINFSHITGKAGKVHFNYIYGLGVFGCLGIYLLLTMMTPNGVTPTRVASTLGYCLLPMCLLSSLGILMSLTNLLGIVTTVAVVLWCAISASKLFVCALDMQHQRILIAYPCALVYSVFALLVIF
ncbi:hypothetical protein CRM22_002533 [Opisthorchis felineus]|uniref:Uncharacterized protein n=1 Tax=Opisthorchis felineus TaxID=147828 RepID=A0A4S2M5N7_OPIFE|nr:hypothetical protein CRM22_002533 [Opisthorchis felineus]